MMVETLRNYVGGQWVPSHSESTLSIRNPATDEEIAHAPLSGDDDVGDAVQRAREAFGLWSETPPYERADYLFRLRDLMIRDTERLAQTITREHGKTLAEARGEVRRAIENVSVAAGVPTLMMGYNSEDVSAGIDEECLFQPLGVYACVAPFNFPLMVPFWFFPYALACGDTYVVKPSERCPMSQAHVFELVDEAGFPPGVINLVHGDRGAVDALVANPDVVGISFVGSTPVGRDLYARGAAAGKRMQCQAGAKNCLVVMPDAVPEPTVQGILSSAFGSAGQRCLAGSLVVAVGGARDWIGHGLTQGAQRIVVGNGADAGVGMGPVISPDARERIVGAIEHAVVQGANLLLDGREITLPDQPAGYYVGPTLVDGVRPDMDLARTEVFGPVLGIIESANLDQAIEIIHGLPYGNAASIYTSSGKAAREFKHRVRVGNVGINVGVAAPLASFPFGGMKASFFGDLHGQGRDAIQFFTDRKVVITRWY